MDDSNTSAFPNMPVWKTYLYQLQLQAPKPKPILCQKIVNNAPPYYGREYHGMISRQEADYLLGNEDGNFLVRESNNPRGSSTLAIKFSDETKNYKVYYDGAFYVGEKRFDSIIDLIHDGLITFYIEKHASQYIAMMCEENNYSETPYFAQRNAILAQRQKHVPSAPKHQSTPAIQPQLPVQQSQQQQQQQHITQLILQQRQQFTDKENRSSNTSSGSSISMLIQNPANKTSNSIFDRFDIMNSEKLHRFKSHNFKGPHWCDFCLNFMWGLVSQGVKCQDCGFQAHKKCSECVPSDCEPQMKYIKRVFGVDLTTLVKATNSIRPIVVEKCIDEIEKRKGAIECEGLYRVSGFNDTIDDLRLAFDRGDNIDFSDWKYNDIHVVCSLLKLYLRQLPIPLITFDVYNKLIDILSVNTNQKIIVEQVKQCIFELPPAHYLTLKYLMEHLVKVTRYSNKNQMNQENLGIIFGPTLMRSFNPDPIIALKNTHKEQKITEMLITNYYTIFDR